MPESASSDLLRFLQKACALQGTCDLSDRELLERFLSNRDEGAFTFLVRRHGPVLFGVCRRLLGDSHDAEDALQAAFLVLVRRTRSIRRKESVGSWLYGVAQHIALNTRTRDAARRNREKEAGSMRSIGSVDDLATQELRSALDEEIGSLPEKYRGPIVLCYLEGKSHEKVAQELGCPKASVTSRLAKARDLLRGKLERRGITLAIGAVATALTGMAAAAPLPATLTIKTVKAATLVATGKAVASGIISAHVLALADGAVRGVFWVKAKMIVMVAGLGLAVGGAGWAGSKGSSEQVESLPSIESPTLALERHADEVAREGRPNSALARTAGWATYQRGDAKQSVTMQKDEGNLIQTPNEKNRETKEEEPRRDLFGDRLPKGAVSRIGTTRFLQGKNGGAPVAYTPDEKILISLDSGTSELFWDATSGKKKGSNSWVREKFKAVVLWDTATGKEARRIELPGDFFYTFLLSPDGKTLSTIGKDNPNIRFWDVATCKEIHQISLMPQDTPDFKESPPAAVFTPDGKAFAASKEDGIIRLWNTATWQQMPSLPKGGNSLLRLNKKGLPNFFFLPDGKTLISTLNGKNGIHWLDIGTGQEIRSLDLSKTNDSGWTLAVSPDGKRIAALVEPMVLYLWNAVTGEEISRISLSSRYHEGRCCLCFSPDSQNLACFVSGLYAMGGANLRETVIFETGTGKEIRRWGNVGSVAGMTYSPDGKTLAHSCGDVIDLRDAQTGKPVLEIGRLPDTILSVAFATDDKSLNTGCRDGRVFSWDSLTGKQLGRSPAPPPDAIPHERYLYGANFSADGKRASVMDVKGVRHIWEPATGKTLCRIEKESEGDYGVFSPDGKILVVKQNSGVWRLLAWDVESGNLLHSYSGGNQRVFSPDGSLLATAIGNRTYGETIYLWETGSGKEMKKLVCQPDPQIDSHIASLAFSPDGKCLVSMHYVTNSEHFVVQGFSRIWDIATGRELRSFPHFVDPQFKFPVISPDGKILATADRDTVILLELATGKERVRFTGHRSSVHSLAFSHDGRFLASGSGDYTALIWDTTGVCPNGKLTQRKVQPAELKRLWTELAGTDAGKAHGTIWTMVASSEQSVPFLAEQLHLVAGAGDKRMAHLLGELDSKDFKVRTQAAKELEELGDLAEPALSKALAGNPSLELHQRVNKLLDALFGKPLSAEQLRMVRAVETLEHVASVQARQVLAELAKGPPKGRLTKEAKASLDRLVSLSR
jgi:RNA polymerase sigma factor (sigma-70 family)